MCSPSSDLLAKDHLHQVYQAVNLSFTDLKYEVRAGWRKKEYKTLLKGVAGSFETGHLIALMGPSGAGKSTLLNVLAGHTLKHFTGEIKINGFDREIETFRKLSCYIMQHDELMPHLTVIETMLVAANLKLTSKVPRSEKRAIVHDILKTLGLEQKKEIRVKQLSGGQRKRLSIAQELVNNPPLMFFDEPTSGLDSQASYQCIHVLKDLVTEGRTVVCTIHQPSAKLFELFDDLYLMAEGECLYRGPVGALLPYLKTQGLECPPYHNPADFAIEVSSGLYGDVKGRLADGVRMGLCDQWASVRSQLTPEPVEVTGSQRKPPEDQAKLEIAMPRKKKPRRQGRMFAADPFTQFVVLFMRSFISILRDMSLTHVRFASHVVVGLLLSALYFGIGNDATKVRENAGMIFFSLLFMNMYTALMPTVMTFPVEMAVFLREHMNAWYSLRSYYFAKVMADMPFQIAFPFLFIVIVYFFTGQPAEASRFFLFIMYATLVSLVAQSSGLVISAATPLKAAVFLGPVSAIPILLLSGFFVPFHRIPEYLQWLSYMSYVRYAFEGICLSVYGLNRPWLSNASCPENNTCACTFQNPTKFLLTMDMSEKRMVPDGIILLVFFFVLRFLCYIVLHCRVRQIW